MIHKKVGIVGVGWENTIEYYRLINQGMNSHQEGYSAYECIIYALNMNEIHRIGWEKSFHILLNACGTLKRSGVDRVVLCGHMAHLFSARLEAALDLPFIHIAFATALKLAEGNFRKVGLIGNAILTENQNYLQKFEEYGLDVILPKKTESHQFIYQLEPIDSSIKRTTIKTECSKVITDLVDKGADCLMVVTDSPQDHFQNIAIGIPLVDARSYHCEAIVTYIRSQINY